MNKHENAKRSNSRRKILIILLFFVVVILVMIAVMEKKKDNTAYMDKQPKFIKQGELTFIGRDNRAIATIDVEIAGDPEKREIGLMGRLSMDENQGMLFIFDQELATSFWMRNTFIPLDMIFVNASGEIITICRNTTPLSDQTYEASGKFLYVIEVNAGFAERHDIAEGDRISWTRK
jgi:uncharacterized membrane protein (UPF0127 family)